LSFLFLNFNRYFILECRENHGGHKVQLLKDIVESQQSRLLKRYKSTKNELENQFKSKGKVWEINLTSQTQTKSEINQFFLELKNIIDQKHKEIIQNVEFSTEKESMEWKKCQKFIEKELKELKAECKFVESATQSVNDPSQWFAIHNYFQKLLPKYVLMDISLKFHLQMEWIYFSTN
jgi:hypothetical protein